jgi:hypothetical protein
MADFGADIISELERLVAAEYTIERFGLQIRVSQLCPPGKVYVMDPQASDLGDVMEGVDRVLVVPTEALAEQARQAAKEVGMKVL